MTQLLLNSKSCYSDNDASQSCFDWKWVWERETIAVDNLSYKHFGHKSNEDLLLWDSDSHLTPF